MKKLRLNKKTISNLNNEELNNVIGGLTVQSCDPNGYTCVSANNGCGFPTIEGCPTESHIRCDTDLCNP